jgi:hypothetical protein
MTRLAIGAYVPTAVWSTLSRDERHRLAAAAAGTRTEHGYRKHAVADLDLHVTEVDGVRTTNLDRTVLDIAMTEPFEAGVVAADWALTHGATKESLLKTLDELAPVKRRRRAEQVVEFGNGLSGSVGESFSRVRIERCGFPPPVLQVRFDDANGLIGFVDFSWPEFRLIGEFDGFEKYSKQQYLAGRVPAEVVFAEKVREDRLRATDDGAGVTRWIWDTAYRQRLLEEQLRSAGLPTRHRKAGGIG